MPTFRVQFVSPVIYQAGHPQAERALTDLLVSAPDATGALTHAIRVVQGDVTGITIHPYDPIAARPPVEAASDLRQDYP